MSEHPDRVAFRQAINKRNGTWYDWGQADCSQQIIDMCKGLGFDLPFTDRNTQGFYDAAVAGNRPIAKMLGSLWLYGSGTTNISHVRLAYDDVVAFGAEGGTRTTNTVEQAKANCAFWRSCDPAKDSRKVYGPYMPEGWYPWIRVTTANLNLRAMPGLDGAILRVLSPNTVVELQEGDPVRADNYDWQFVVADGRHGWVALEYTKL